MTLFRLLVLSIVAIVVGLVGVVATYNHAGSKHAVFAFLTIIGSGGLVASFIWLIVWVIGLIF